MTETIELSAGAARVAVAPSIGGSIAAFEYAGHPILRPTSDTSLAAGSARNFACFPLIPFSNRIAGARLRWAERDYRLTRPIATEPHAIHGNGWQRRWSVTRREASHLAIELEHDAKGSRALEWPFPYRAQQQFDLVADDAGVTLRLRLQIENAGQKSFPFGLGWHPYFDRDAETELGFAAVGVWQTDRSCLPTRWEATPVTWIFDPPRSLGAMVVDNCFTGWRPPATVRWPARMLAATITADPACSFLVVFIPANEAGAKPFFALEPVTHMTDAFNRSSADDGADTGTRVLAPGARFSCTMSISASSTP